LLADIQEVNVARDGDEAFTRLWAGLQRAGLDPNDSFVWSADRPPYPGLGTFTEQDAAVFFGREPEIERLLELLQPTLHGPGRFVAVVGPSGIGKSSLVRAGLLPRLARLPRWLVVPRLVPSRQPIRQLARSLAQAFRERGVAKEVSALAAELDGGPSALVELIEELRDASTGEPPSVLLVVDQLEELVTVSGASERAAFIGLLRGVVHSAIDVWVVATLRAEFLSPLLQQQGMAGLVDETLLVGPLDRGRLFAVIEKPARRSGLEFAPGLVGRLVEDAQGGDALPLLSFTLRQLAAQAGPDGQITDEAFEDVGGVVGALRAQADSTAENLASEGYRDAVVATLVRLATVTDEGEPTRRRVSRGALTMAEDEVVQAFIEARLLVSSSDEQDRAIVEVAHEALLRQWPPLHNAIEARRAELRVRADLERWVLDWDRAGQQASYLIGEERLEVAQRWAIAHPQELRRLPQASEFLAQSSRKHDIAMQRASEELASRALSELDRDPELAMLLAIAAVEEAGPSTRATQALDMALGSSYVGIELRGHKSEVVGVTFSPDGSRLATASLDHSAKLWDPDAGSLMHTLHHEREVTAVAFSPDGSCLATASFDGTARLWDAATGSLLHTFHHQGRLLGVAFAPDCNQLATALDDHTAFIWLIARDTEPLVPLVLRGHKAEIVSVAFSSDGSRLATASVDGTTGLWDTATGAHLHTLHHQPGEEGVVGIMGTIGEFAIVGVVGVAGVTFSPDGTHLATAAGRTARLWDPMDYSHVRTLRHELGVWGVAFSSDSTRLATASADRTCRLWDTASGAELRTLRGHEADVVSVAFSPDGIHVATASGHVARLWDAASDSLLVAKARMRVERQLTEDERRMVGLPT
jgi:hypothetical protein